MRKPFNISEEILKTLAKNNYKWHTLEELSNFIFPVYSDFLPIKEKLLIERQIEAKVLDTLIYLNNKGFVILNSITDESKIKIKGLISTKINDYLN